MPSTTTIAFASIFAFASIIAGYVYVFGIPPEMKRKLEKQALQTMGENKASYMMKDTIGKMPESDQKELNDVKNTVSGVTGSALQNPLGDMAGETADDATKGFTGR
ncbi:hypothetical protein TI39_contig305g00019 [Zymoseptoria brevis]|uniref:Uncharacterized protein n=1 Tax=Zymoseptoria brevis TaxID=1047168 RepID=A0A0F4GUE8_9PEZI|nr:hypothetical protein TI39_contig305g00019 [Zymoseptoria brevis]